MNDPRKSYRGYLISSTRAGHFQYAGLAEVLPFLFTQDAPQELTCAMIRGIVSIHLSTMHFGNQDNLCVRIELADQLVAFIMDIHSKPASRHSSVDFGLDVRKAVRADGFRVPFCENLVALAANHLY